LKNNKIDMYIENCIIIFKNIINIIDMYIENCIIIFKNIINILLLLLCESKLKLYILKLST